MRIGEPIDELKSTKIWRYLNEINSDYASRSIVFLNGIVPLLSTIQDHFPYYTRHDAHHGFRVLKRLEQAVLDKCFEHYSGVSFTPEEAYLLICSAYSHDLGMTVFPGEKEQLLEKLKIKEEKDWERNSSLQQYLRENHANRGGQYINEHSEILSVPHNLISLLDLLMKSHNFSLNELDVELGKRFATGEGEIDMRQIACILCISDLIEFSDTRVVDGVLDSIREKIQNEYSQDIYISYQENMKHVCIGDSLAVGDDGKVIVSGTFKDPDVLALAHRTFDFIEIWLRNYVDIDYKSKLKRLKIRSDSVERTLNILGFDFERLGIRIKKENVIDLISSNSTWSTDKGIVIRELLQNSVEACRYRQFNSSMSDEYFPEIKVLYSRTNNSIEIRDNGCGMSRSVILNNFLTVGNSRSLDPTYTLNKFNSFARFGIGFWSVFTIAESAIIRTAPYEYGLADRSVAEVEGLTFTVSINEFKDYTVFKSEKMKPGTSVMLKLKGNQNVEDIIARLDYHLGYSKIPIIIKSDSESYEIPSKLNELKFEDLFGAKLRLANQSNVQMFTHNAEFEDLNLNMHLLYRTEQGKATFQLENRTGTILQIMDHHHFQRDFAICGFWVNLNVFDTILDVRRHGKFCVWTENPKGFQFTLNRLGLIQTQRLNEVIQTVRHLIHNGYRSFLKSTNSYDPESIYKLNTQSRMHGGEGHGSYTNNRLKVLSSEASDLLSFKLYKIEKGKGFNDCPISYLLYNDLIKEDFVLWSCSSYVNLGGLRLTPDQSHPVFYDLINSSLDETQNAYYVESNLESSLLFDNDPSSSIKVIPISNSKESIVNLAFKRTNTISLNPDLSHSKLIGNLRGVPGWAGSIFEIEIEGANFASIGQHNMLVKTGSVIANEVKKLVQAGLNHKLGNLLKLLEEANQGFIDPSIAIYC